MTWMGGGRSPAAWGLAATVSAMMALAVAGTASGTTPARAVDLNLSRLSSIDLVKCRVVRRHRDGNAWRCPGLPGYPVYIAEGDLRFMMAFGPRPLRRRSATQTLAPFNTIFIDKRRPTIEWRVDRDAAGRIVPFATIVRYSTSLDEAQGEVLVITKVDRKESCQLAVIDARATPDAMAVARAWAIAEARQKTCPDHPEVVGVKGKGPM